MPNAPSMQSIDDMLISPATGLHNSLPSVEMRLSSPQEPGALAPY